MQAIVLISCLCAIAGLIEIIGVHADLEPNKLKVEIYYETLCPDSIRFIKHQLHPAMTANSLLQFTDLEFIPYGKVWVQTDPNSNETHLFCQHGERECELNALHACIVEHNTIREQLDLISCLFSNSMFDLDRCAQNLNIDVTAAKNCKVTRKTADILKKYADKTATIEISFVPSIALNGTFDPWKQNAILHNFSQVFCRKYQQVFGIALEKC